MLLRWIIMLSSSALILPVTALLGFDYEAEHVLTVCNNISHTRKGQVIPDCPELPSPKGFFEGLRPILYEQKCDNSTTNESKSPTLIQHGILAFKWLVDGIKEQLKQLTLTLISRVEDVSGFTAVTRRWNSPTYLVLACIASALFHLSVRRSSHCLTSLWLGFTSSGVLYFAHLYYRNPWITIAFILVEILAFSPFSYPLRAVGLMTLAHLLLPLLGTAVRTVFVVQLVLGPVLNTFINVGSILVHIVCLIGLYVDEKLMIVKVFLLPVYQTFLSLFEHNDTLSSLLDSIAESVDGLLNGIVQNGHSPNQLDSVLRKLCENATTAWYNSCPALFAQSCKSLVDRTDLAQADKGLEVAGKWLTDLLTGQRKKSTVQRTVSKQLCQKLSSSVCQAIDIGEYCTPDKTFYDLAYDSFQSAFEKLKRSVLASPWIKMILPDRDFNGTSIIEMDFDLIGFLYHCFSLVLAIFALCLILRALILTVLFLRRYRRNPRFAEKVSRTRFSIKFGLLVKVFVCFLVEWATRSFHDFLQGVQFVVPEYGDARFAFNVQGNGTMARIFSSFLSGGFLLQSKYCKLAKSSVCSTYFFPVSWQSWAMLFVLASVHLFVGVIQSRSDYVMSLICRHIFRDHSRASAHKAILKAEKFRRVTAIQLLAEEQMERNSARRAKQTVKLLAFYRRHPAGKCHRFLPVLILSLIAWHKFGVDNLYCQICVQNIITSRFRCKNSLLFCPSCEENLIAGCPCCGDRQIVRL